MSDDTETTNPRKIWVRCGCPTMATGGWSVNLEDGPTVTLLHPPPPPRESGPPLRPETVKARDLLNEFLRLRAAASPEVGRMLDQLSDPDACRAASPEVDQALGNLEAWAERTRREP